MSKGSGDAHIRSKRIQQGKFHSYRGALLLVFLVLSLWVMRAFLLPVIMGAIFATVLYPFLNRMARWRISVTWKSAIVTLAFLFVFLVPVGILLVFGSQAAVQAVQAAQEKAEIAGAPTWSVRNMMIMFRLDGVIDWIAQYVPLDEAAIKVYAIEGLKKFAGIASVAFQGLVASLPNLFLSTFLILLTIFYLLIDGRRAVRFVSENSFFSPSTTGKMLHALHELCYSSVVASIVTGAVQTTIICVACVINGTDHLFFIALVTFILSFLPMFGTAPITAFLVGQSLISGNTAAAIVFLVFGVIASLSDNVVRPWALRGGADMHPLLGFVSAFGGLEVMGFWGLFIGPVIVGFTFYMMPLVTRTYKAGGNS